jgi:nucleoside-diphosphate-sugar epimerase
MANKKVVWLTGAGGFIGSHLGPALEKVYSEVRYFSNTKGSSRNYMDFGSEEDIRKNIELFGLPDLFIHIGWGAMTDPESKEHLTANVHAGKTLIETLFKAGLPKFVFLGSANEYGAREGLLSEDMPPVGRRTAYAEGKTQVASFGLEQAAKYNKTFISIRVFYAYGSGQRPGSLINKLYNCYRENIKPDLGPCEHFRDYIHVSEVAQGITLISGTNESGIVNLGSGKVIKLKDFVTLFWKSFGGNSDDLQFGAHAARAGEPEQPYAFASTERLKRLTGWVPSLSIEEGIKLTIEGLKAK